MHEYWLLLAAVVAVGSGIVMIQQAGGRSDIGWQFGACLLALAALLVVHIALRFELQEGLLRLLYWGRGLLLVAWLGHSYARFSFPANAALKRLTLPLAVASLLALGLTLITQLTRAQDWYEPAQPIFTQFGELLALNRPIRWLAVALNTYGVAAVGLVLVLGQRTGGAWAGSALAAAGVGLLAAAFLLPSENMARLYTFEALPALLLFGAWLHKPKQETAK